MMTVTSPGTFDVPKWVNSKGKVHNINMVWIRFGGSFSGLSDYCKHNWDDGTIALQGLGMTFTCKDCGDTLIEEDDEADQTQSNRDVPLIFKGESDNDEVY